MTLPGEGWTWYDVKNDPTAPDALVAARGIPGDDPPTEIRIRLITFDVGARQRPLVIIDAAGRRIEVTMSPRGRRCRVHVDGVEVEA